jgi:ribose transport system ATP-binding protein
MVRLMVGRDVDRYYQHTRRQSAGDVVLGIRNVVLVNEPAQSGRPSRTNEPDSTDTDGRTEQGPARGLSFELRAGEIVGFAGLVGAGRTELARAVFGIDPIRSGTVELDGNDVRIRDPRSAIRHGLGLVPEDRKQQGLILEMAVAPNISMAGLIDYGRFGLLDHGRELDVARRGARELSIRATSLAQPTVTLSGGNQQKVVLARWLVLQPRVLILDEPTRGVDVGCKSEIYTLMSRLARRGVAIWMISSEMEELLAMSDRVIVMHEGRIAGELTGDGITEERIMMLAVGGHVDTLGSRGLHDPS